MATVNKILTEIRKTKPRSAWNNGVKMYAIDLLNNVKEDRGGSFDITTSNYKKALLNGAKDWKQYSESGNALIYNVDIAKRLCTKTELAKTRNGLLRPNAREDWLDVQARALYQAGELIYETIRDQPKANTVSKTSKKLR